MEKCNNTNKSSNRLGGGLLLLVIGLIFLVRNFGLDVPDWIFSWHTILIAIGLLIGYRRNFTGSGWMVMVLIGSIFTLKDIFDMNLSQYYIAAGFIIMGLYLLFKPSGIKKRATKKNDWDLGVENPQVINNESSVEDSDFIDSVNVMGGSKQQLFSKNFKGGDVVSILGGCDLNLTQADFDGTITLDVIAILGGVKIIIPPTWVVKTELTPIFGGVDDKRSVPPLGEGPHKILKIKGLALFGGVDIRNY